MTPNEFKKEMEIIAKYNDTEVAHYEADELLCDILKELGFEEGVEIFENMGRWYA